MGALIEEITWWQIIVSVIAWIIVLVYSCYVCRIFFYSAFPHGVNSLKEIQWNDTWKNTKKWMRSRGAVWLGICVGSLFLGEGIRNTFESAERDERFLVGTFLAFLLVVTFWSAGIAWKENERLKREKEHLERELKYQRAMGT